MVFSLSRQRATVGGGAVVRAACMHVKQLTRSTHHCYVAGPHPAAAGAWLSPLDDVYCRKHTYIDTSMYACMRGASAAWWMVGGRLHARIDPARACMHACRGKLLL